MAITQFEDFRIDISHEQSFRYLQAKQFDHNSRIRRLIITNNNIPIIYKGNELITLSLYINGNNYSNTVCHFHDDGYPYVVFKEAMLSHEGDVSCEIRIYDSDEEIVVTTFEFMMTVSKSLLNQDRLVESSEFNILNYLILQANTIPDLIKNFKFSQDEINSLIEKIKSDITSYTNQFSSMKNKYTNDFNALLTQIRSNISAYQSEYNILKTDITTLKSNVTNWYISAEAAENTRSQNENIRLQNENARIQAESLRVDEEIIRKHSEQERIDYENLRIRNETLRSDNEKIRILSENVRKTNESNRLSDEIARNYNESIRIDNENIRLANESKRESIYGRHEELLEKLLMIVDIDTAATILDGGSSNTVDYTNIIDAGNATTANYNDFYDALKAW